MTGTLGLNGRRNCDFLTNIGTVGFNPFVGWEQKTRVRCQQRGRYPAPSSRHIISGRDLSGLCDTNNPDVDNDMVTHMAVWPENTDAQTSQRTIGILGNTNLRTFEKLPFSTSAMMLPHLSCVCRLECHSPPELPSHLCDSEQPTNYTFCCNESVKCSCSYWLTLADKALSNFPRFHQKILKCV